MAAVVEDRTLESVSRQENLQELLNGVAEFCETQREEGSEHPSLSDFLSEVALITDQDHQSSNDCVTMMTVHAANGLEFKNVFVVGMEEDLFPSAMSKDDPKSVEEERRLFYVAITRAEENCVLSYAKSRYRNGKTDFCAPSRFLKDIDRDYLAIPSTVGNNGGSSAMGSYSAPTVTSEPAFRSPLRQVVPSHLTRLRPEETSKTPFFRSGVESRSNASAKPVTNSLPNTGGFQIGSRVRHERFGEGKVLAMEGEGGNLKITVAFSMVGQK